MLIFFSVQVNSNYPVECVSEKAFYQHHLLKRHFYLLSICGAETQKAKSVRSARLKPSESAHLQHLFQSPQASPWHSRELSQRAVLQPHQPLHPSEMLKLNILIFLLIKVHIVQREIIIIIKLALHVPC